MKFVDLDAQFDQIDGDIREAIERVLQHKQFIMGPEIAVLEQELSDYCGAARVISAASGTDALMMALMAHGVGPGDGILAPPFTFVATAEVVELLGATTVFVDVDDVSFNMDPALLNDTIERVKAQGGEHEAEGAQYSNHDDLQPEWRIPVFEMRRVRHKWRPAEIGVHLRGNCGHGFGDLPRCPSHE